LNKQNCRSFERKSPTKDVNILDGGLLVAGHFIDG